MKRRQRERLENREKYRKKHRDTLSRLLERTADYPSADWAQVKNSVTAILNLSPNNNHNKWLVKYFRYIELQKGVPRGSVREPKKDTTIYIWLKEQRSRFSGIGDTDTNEEANLKREALEAAGYVFDGERYRVNETSNATMNAGKGTKTKSKDSDSNNQIELRL